MKLILYYIFFFSLLVSQANNAISFVSKKNSEVENSFENTFQKKNLSSDKSENFVVVFEDNFDDDDITSIKKKSLLLFTFCFNKNINSLKSFCNISKGNCSLFFGQLSHPNFISLKVLRV